MAQTPAQYYDALLTDVDPELAVVTHASDLEYSGLYVEPSSVLGISFAPATMIPLLRRLGHVIRHNLCSISAAFCTLVEVRIVRQDGSFAGPGLDIPQLYELPDFVKASLTLHVRQMMTNKFAPLSRTQQDARLPGYVPILLPPVHHCVLPGADASKLRYRVSIDVGGGTRPLTLWSPTLDVCM